MPRYKTVIKLYQLSIKNVCENIYKLCVNLEKSEVLSKSQIIEAVNNFFRLNIPTCILDDILVYYSKNYTNSATIITYYFYNTILHNQIRKFRAKNLQLKLSYWEIMFRSFSNLVDLNLALSCSDNILRLVGNYCPNLEVLNATCRYERIRMGSNATSFALSVTDGGLEYLSACQKLKVLTLNEPRSQRNGARNSITYSGLRHLLLTIPTLEDITYSDLGSVISQQGFESVDFLNLRTVRHFSATEASIKEILRLCHNLNQLYLTFFDYEDHTNILKAILGSTLRPKSLGLVNFNFGYQFDTFFEQLGSNLIYLSVSNCIQTITFANLLTIGRCCPNLKFLKYILIDNSRDRFTINRSSLDKRFEYFSKIEDLFISGNDLDLENILILCTQNAENLENFKLNELYAWRNCDELFLKYLNNRNLKHIEISSKLEFSERGVKKMIDKFPNLNYLSVYCADNCAQIKEELLAENYDLTFINQKNSFIAD